MQPITGIHHVTAISGPAQINVDFYVGFLGLRLVKTTVNFDDPGTHHLYFGDETGTPGAILTFFPWARSLRGNVGAGQTAEVLLSVPENALPYWIDRATLFGVQALAGTLFGEPSLTMEDADGMRLVLVATAEAAPSRYWTDSPVPKEFAIRGIRGVTLWARGFDDAAEFFQGPLGFEHLAEADGRRRYRIGHSVVDVVAAPGAHRGRMGSGAIHHVAFRAADGSVQLEWQAHLLRNGANVSPVMDRTYFTSIYFKEPGGVLFEIATDGPGFTFDEPLETLGSGLMLPAWLEEERTAIEAVLPKLTVPVGVAQ